MKTDLHLHTSRSDGRLTPDKLLALCQQKEYNTVSICDHDTIDGYLSVKDQAKEYGMELIPGVEVSSYHNGAEIHILLYYYNEEDGDLLELLDYINESRINRAKKIIVNLKSIGINLDFDDIFDRVGKSKIIGRAHIARELRKTITNLSINEIFDKYLNENSELFVPKITVCVKDIIPILKKTGGVTVLAHPHRLRKLSLLEEIIGLGIDGLEVYCPKSSNYYLRRFKRAAKDNNLLITGGSDFHGEPYELEDFGNFSVPEECVTALKNFKKQLNTYPETSDRPSDEVYKQVFRFD